MRQAAPLPRVNVLNDETHHCYRHKVGADAEGALTGDDKKEAAENEEAARLWINGIEALDRKVRRLTRERQLTTGRAELRLDFAADRKIVREGARLL